MIRLAVLMLVLTGVKPEAKQVPQPVESPQNFNLRLSDETVFYAEKSGGVFLMSKEEDDTYFLYADVKGQTFSLDRISLAVEENQVYWQGYDGDNPIEGNFGFSISPEGRVEIAFTGDIDLSIAVDGDASDFSFLGLTLEQSLTPTSALPIYQHQPINQPQVVNSRCVCFGDSANSKCKQDDCDAGNDCPGGNGRPKCKQMAGVTQTQ